MANNERAESYYEETAGRKSRETEARRQDNGSQAGGSRNVQPARNTGYSLELLESGDDDDEEEFRDTPNAIRKQSRVASEISKQSENKTSYSEQIEQYYTKTRSRVQSVISNNARARDRHVTRREFDITSELLLDTVNIRLSLYSH